VVYAVLGSAPKLVPGLNAPSYFPSGKPFDFGPLIRAGLPIAPVIEYGSYARGTPDIMRYGRDPYKGLGLGRLRSRRIRPFRRMRRRLKRKFMASGGPGIDTRRSDIGSLGQVSRWLCEGEPVFQEAEQSFREEMRGLVNTAAVATTLAGAAGGAVGALIHRPVVGAIAGAVIGYFAHATQVATMGS